MRQYRGKRVDGKGWVYGYYFADANGRHFILECRLIAFPDPDDDWMVDCFIEVTPETVGQSIGVKDKDGVEIYCGDTFRVGGGVFVVCWVETMAGFELRSIRTDGWKNINHVRRMSRLGTIHDKEASHD